MIRCKLVTIVMASAVLGAGAALTAEKTIIHSTVFEWSDAGSKPNAWGAVRQVVRSATPTLDELECHITTLNPGESPHPPHKHPDEELIIVKEGTVESTLNGKTYQLGPGSVIFQASNEMHGIRNVGKTPATYHVIKWNTPGMLKAKQKS